VNIFIAFKVRRAHKARHKEERRRKARQGSTARQA
jgi:hypothetical protein